MGKGKKIVEALNRFEARKDDSEVSAQFDLNHTGLYGNGG
jgi:hypothetical protein